MPAAIAYERTGSGPPLVLVHGITESRHSWAPLIPSLAERFDVVAVDLRGHGNRPRFRRSTSARSPRTSLS